MQVPLVLTTIRDKDVRVDIEMIYDKKYNSFVTSIVSPGGKRIGDVLDVDNGLVEIDCKKFIDANDFYSVNEWKERGINASGKMQMLAIKTNENSSLKDKLEMMKECLIEANF